MAKKTETSVRGEYEITNVNNEYLLMGNLQVGIINLGNAWIVPELLISLRDACEFVRAIEKRKKQKIGCV
jgi:glucose-1-phosphate thymidylyltransferase